MSGDFLDSNVILYQFDLDERKYNIAKAIVTQGMDGSAWISFQVVQEVLNVLTRKLPPLSAEQEALRALNNVLLPLWRVMPSEELYSRALSVRTRYGYAFYDSLIIAAALESGATRLYSEDLQAGQRIDQLTIINPFAPA